MASMAASLNENADVGKDVGIGWDSECESFDVTNLPHTA